MAAPFIQLENVSASYEADDHRTIPVLRHLSLTIDKGEYVAILGHNGSGKSTLAKLINMILTPDEGSITVDGVTITDPAVIESEEQRLSLRRRVGMVFQNPDNQLIATIVEDDVAFGPENLGVPPEQIRQRVDEVLASLGMREYAKHEPHRLSGGQKQRVAIAGVLAMRPDCIIFDESTSMLDPRGRAEVLSAIDRLHEELGMTVITITHYMDEAARASRVIVLNDGEIALDGTPEEVFDHESELLSFGLDVPQCTSVIHALQREGLCPAEGAHQTPEQCAEMILGALRKECGHG
ncbi:MAG: energy-coupling factor transporter ATPase [Ruminococcaceae bacterium]|nr:energy-coupling factor transporter ATPase [Oscillospiraceae bacterium]